MLVSMFSRAWDHNHDSPERTSYRNLINQRWIVIAAADFVHAARHWPHAQLVVGSRSQQFGPAAAVQPSLEISLVEDHRHAVVNRSRERIGIRHYKCLPLMFVSTSTLWRSADPAEP